MKIKKESILFSLVVIYFTCYFMKIFDFPDLLTLGAGAALSAVFLIKQKKIRVDVGVCLIAITMFSYCIVVFGIRAMAIMMPYIPIVIYVLSHYFAKEIKGQQNSEIVLSKVVFCLIFGHAVHGILNSCMYFAGYRVEGTRTWMDIWEQQMVPGTQLTVYFLAAFAVLFPAIIYFSRNKWRNVGTVLVTLFFVYASLATRTRTTLLILMLVFAGQVLLYAILEKDTVKKVVTPKRVGLFAVGLIGVVVVLAIALKDNEMIQVFIDNMDKDGGILNNIRFKAQRQALSQIFVYPMGGNKMVMDLNMAHNAWLDIANVAGVIPFFAFIAYTLWTSYELIRFISKKEIDTEIKLMIAGLYASFFLYYMVEPALNASVHYITPWMLINGLVHGYITRD